MSNWHVWSINPQRYKKVEEYLATIFELQDVLYPTVVKEYNTKAGKQTKDVPIYSNYLFLKYKQSNTISSKLEDCPWIQEYIGTCSKEEIKDVKALTHRKYEDIMPMDEIKEGCTYRLKGTPFKDMSCTIVTIDGDKVSVLVPLFGSDRLIKCSIDDIDFEG